MSSIVTGKGDKGQTSTLFGRKIPKDDLHIEAVGAIQELSCAIGLAKAAMGVNDPFRTDLEYIQKCLIKVMGAVGVETFNLERYEKKFPGSRVHTGDVAALDTGIRQVEQDLPQAGWTVPGETELSARLDFATAVCRRAERRAVELCGANTAFWSLELQYLNRLSDYLYLMARDHCPPS